MTPNENLKRLNSLVNDMLAKAARQTLFGEKTMTPEQVILTYVRQGVRYIERVRDLSGLHSVTFGSTVAELLDSGRLLLSENGTELITSAELNQGLGAGNPNEPQRLFCSRVCDKTNWDIEKYDTIDLDCLPDWNKDEERVGSDKEIVSQILGEYLEERDKDEIHD